MILLPILERLKLHGILIEVRKRNREKCRVLFLLGKKIRLRQKWFSYSGHAILEV